jgi:hypothetical protein
MVELIKYEIIDYRWLLQQKFLQEHRGVMVNTPCPASCEYDNETSGSMQDGEFLGWLNVYGASYSFSGRALLHGISYIWVIKRLKWIFIAREVVVTRT